MTFKERVDALALKVEAQLKDSVRRVPCAPTACDEVAYEVDAANLLAVCRALRDAPELKFEMLMDVAGVDYLPQRVREVLSMQRGESPFSPTFGMRFFEYFEAYRRTRWLDLLLKLDVVRQASIPFKDGPTGRMHTPLQCVTRVRNVDLLADMPTKNRLPVRVDFDVQGVGPWTRELSICVPTAEQMAERAKMLAGMPWLADALRGKPA